jgi:hypothetical protein
MKIWNGAEQFPTQLLIEWVTGNFIWGIKRPVREIDHSPQSSAEFKSECNYTSTTSVPFHVVNTDNFKLYLLNL